jgi:AraC-like DNA-binding protein
LQNTAACLQIHVDLNCPHLAEATGGGAIRLTEIALSCGFYDLSHFSKAYKERYEQYPKAKKDKKSKGDSCAILFSNTQIHFPLLLEQNGPCKIRFHDLRHFSQPIGRFGYERNRSGVRGW